MSRRLVATHLPPELLRRVDAYADDLSRGKPLPVSRDATLRQLIELALDELDRKTLPRTAEDEVGNADLDDGC